MLEEICKQPIFLDETKTLFFDKEAKALFEWNKLKEELKPISYKAAFKKYKSNLNINGEEYFEYVHDSEAEKVKAAFFHNCIYTAGISASMVIFFAGLIFAMNPDTETRFPFRVLSVFAGTLPICIIFSYDKAKYG